MCSKVLAQKGEHKKCALLPVAEGGKCEGFERTVTVTDYQRALRRPVARSTYEVGALEIARRNVHDTWLCVTLDVQRLLICKVPRGLARQDHPRIVHFHAYIAGIDLPA